ncbi:hypothetical protein [Streptomyces sp. NBC_00690]|uniref:hypothetical protein n=1 Tax=Streptomyces sp. NBC_00690 TaxID=2975808 RepID=UPI002E2D05DA|nr:hypothetical protein [Streptomyces sp. NBC_00690]
MTEGASVGECVRRAWTTLRNAGQPMDVRLPDWAGDAGGDGIGILVLDWLVDQGASVFLKADGERSTPGWTFIVQFGPLTQTLRADGPRVERCFGQVVSRLRAEGTNVPV